MKRTQYFSEHHKQIKELGEFYNYYEKWNNSYLRLIKEHANNILLDKLLTIKNKNENQASFSLVFCWNKIKIVEELDEILNFYDNNSIELICNDFSKKKQISYYQMPDDMKIINNNINLLEEKIKTQLPNPKNNNIFEVKIKTNTSTLNDDFLKNLNLTKIKVSKKTRNIIIITISMTLFLCLLIIIIIVLIVMGVINEKIY